MSSLAFRLLAAQQAVAAASNSNLFMWGNNTYGQLGIGSVNTYYSWAQINAGGSHTVAIRNDGMMFGWGNNNYGQLGDGTTISKNSPVQLNSFSWTAVTAGHGHTAAIRNDGTLWAWGSNQYYQLNDNTTVDKSYPVLISGESWSKVAAGALHTLAVKSDGTLWGWGSDDSGQIGSQNTFSKLTIGISHYAGIKADGTLWTGGTNVQGQLGDGTQVAKSFYLTPSVRIPGSWINVHAGPFVTYGVRSDTTLWAWGDNVWGALGQNDTVSRSSPIQVPGTSNVVELSAFGDGQQTRVSLWRDSSNRAYGLGYNLTGSLGDGTQTHRSTVTQVLPLTPDSISIGYFNGMVLASDYTLWAWGDNTYGEFGNGVTDTVYKSSAVQISTDKWISIETGGGSVFAIKSDYTLWSWGNNSNGELGTNDVGFRSSPVQVPGSWSTVVAAGGLTLAIKTDSTLWSWGNNVQGMLGQGDNIARSSPTQVGTSSWISVSAHPNGVTVSAIRLDRALFVWGSGNAGAMGDSTTLAKNSPVQIGTSSWMFVSAGSTSMAAIDINYRLFMWGSGLWGMIGDNTTVGKSSPIQIGSSSWMFVAAGANSTQAVDINYRLFSWGRNNNGQLGQNDTVDRSSPTQIGTSSWVAVYSGVQNNFALRLDGTLWGYGNNSPTSALLGDNTVIAKSSPVQVGLPSIVRGLTSISSGGQVSGGLDLQGRLWTWGNGADGGRGDGTTVNKLLPLLTMTDKFWKSVKFGWGTGYGIDNNNKLWTWGNNTWGQLGDGTSNNRSSPVQIGTNNWSSILPADSLGSVIGTDTNNKLWGWGNNRYNILGLGESTSIARAVPTLINGITGPFDWVASAPDQFNLVQANGTVYSLGGAQAAAGAGISTPSVLNTFNQSYQRLTKIGANSYTYIHAGKFHNTAITADNRLFTWGNNSAGQLGDNTVVTRSSPVQVAGSWLQAHAGGTHSFGLTLDSKLFAWGNNTYGQLGISDAASLFWTKIHDGGSHLVAVRSDGALFAWGLNDIGQLGDGTTVNKNSPVQIGSNSWVSVTAGPSHTAAIRSDGSLYTWGLNTYGQLGLGYGFNKVSWSQVALSSHVAAIKADGTLWMWGFGTNYQLGLPIGAVTVSYPTQLGNDRWVNVAVGNGHTLGIKKDGTVWAWGSNTFGTLGDGTVSQKTAPYQVFSASKNFVKVLAGNTTSGALTSDGTLHMWGRNIEGQLGVSDTINRSSPVQLGAKWSSVAISTQTLAIKTDGTLWAWGSNSNGQLGDGTTISKSSPIQVMSGSWISIAAGSTISAAVRNDGSLWVWGDNTYGQLGQANTISRSTPIQVGLKSWTSVSALINWAMVATRTDTTVWAWGYNLYGALGQNDTIHRSSPVQVPGLSGGSLVYSGVDGYNGAYTINGQLYMWGQGNNFSIGDGINAYRSAPVQLGVFANTSSPVQVGTDSWSQVAAGGSHTLGIKSDNSLYGWGSNFAGQVGGTSGVLNPVTWTKIVGNTTQTFGIRNDGRLYAWGLNTFGQLGDRTIVSKSSPVQITSSSFTNIASGDAHTLAITTDGILFGWGKNDYGQSGTLSWVQVSSSLIGSHTVAVRSDGQLFAWGLNNFGQLGDNTTVNRSSPVQLTTQSVYSANSWLSVSSGASHTVAIRSDYTLWTWGNNAEGELGDLSIVNRSSPVQVGIPYPTMSFNGSTEYVYVSSTNTGFAFPTSTDFTIEMWVNPTARAASVSTIYDTRPAGTGSTATYQLLNIAPNGSLSYISGTLSTFGGFLPLNTWSHIAVARQGTTTRLFINGAVVGTPISGDTTAYIVGASRPIIGTDGNVVNSAGYNFAGFINNLRVVKGVAVYTDNFTVPTSDLQTTQSSGTNISAITAGQTTFLLGTIFSDKSNNNILNTTNIGAATTQAPFVYSPFAVSFTQIATPMFGTMVLTTDNTLWHWGRNDNGNLLDGSVLVNRSSPVQVAGSWSSISGGLLTEAAIDTSGQLFIWGDNTSGTLGDGTTINRSSPVQLAGTWNKISLGTYYALAIKSDSTLWAWGLNSFGQLGQSIGNTIARSSPVQIGTSSWSSVSAGNSFGYATTIDGKLYGWGNNNLGQIGTPFISYSVVNGGSSYIRNDGRLYIWGRNDNGQLGFNDTVNRSSPVQLGTDSWLMVNSTNADTPVGFHVGIKTDGTLWAWGYNNFGNLGTSDTIYRSSPVQVPGSWLSVYPGYMHTLAVRNDKTLWAWGRNSEGQLGDGTSIDRNSPVLVTTSITSWSQVSAGAYHNLAISNNGNLYGWGQNSIGQITDNAITFLSVADSSAVRADGQLWVWGRNVGGSIGDSTTVNRSSPVQIAGTWRRVARKTVGTYPTTHAIRADGTLWGWGLNTVGTIGDTSTVSRSSPVQVGSDTTWIKLNSSPAGDNTAAIKSDGTLWVWGFNTGGQLGLGDNINRSSPVQLAGSWIHVSMDTVASFGIKTDGTLWAWGLNNAAGPLGLGDTIARSSPVQVGTSTWVAIETAQAITIAIRSDGTLFTWGGNNLGQLGDSTTINKSSPVQISTAGTNSWTIITTSGIGSAAIRADGTLWTWGAADAVGEGTGVPRSSPAQLGGAASASRWTQIASGYFDFYAVSTGGKVHNWGNINTYGNLGNNSVIANGSASTSTVSANLNGTIVTSVSSPIQIGTSSWVQVSAGASFSMAVKSGDNSLWTWGTGQDGVLGHGLTTARSSPVQVGVLSWSMINASIQLAAGITNTGGLYTWGYGLQGGLGSGATASRSAPVQVATSSWSMISLGGFNNAIALDSNNRLFTWGTGTYGDVGDNTVVTKSSPVLISALETTIWLPTLINTSSWSVVSAGASNATAITSQNRMLTWGLNTGGQLGDTSTVSRSSPVQVAAGTQSPNRSSPVQIMSGSWTSVAAGNSFSAAVRNDGTIFAWGFNSTGQLGDSTTLNRSYPTQLVSSTSWTQVATGIDFTLAKDTNARLYAWGNGATGALGASNQASRSSPVQINNSSWTQIAAGAQHAIGLVNNTLYGWGRNSEGQLTNILDIGWSVVQSSSDGNSVIGIDMLGRLFAWGNPGIGVNGIGYQDNGTTARSRPVQIAVGQSFIALSTNNSLSQGNPGIRFVIDSNNNLWAWGDNSIGTFGDNTTVSRSSPVQLNLGQSWKKIVQGTNGVVFGLTTSGTLFGWGRNGIGQLGLGDVNNRSQPVQILGSWSDVSTGNLVAHGIKSDGTLWGWGTNLNGEIGDNTTNYRSSPVQIMSGKNFIAVSHGANSSYSISASNELYAWGQNTSGALGDNTAISRSSPVQVGNGIRWSKIQGGQRTTIALAIDNRPYAWGQNDTGQLGLGDVISRSTPVQITSLPNIKSLMTMLDPTNAIIAFIDTNNKLWTAGNNTNGILGDGTVANRSNPVQVSMGATLSPVQLTTSSYTSISAGYTHTAAVTSNGKLFVWGGNGSYQLGDSTSINRSSPVQLGTGTSFVFAAAVGNATFGGTTFGTYAVGENVSGQLGIITAVTTSALAQVSEPMNVFYPAPLRIGASSWSQVSAGTSHSVALRIDSSLYAWGDNTFGALGDNTAVSKSSPVLISSSSWIQVSAGRDMTAAIRNNNLLYTWGNNPNGQLGDGTTVTKSSPVQVSGYWTDVEVGGSFVAALNVNGSVWTWGNNPYGALGLNVYKFNPLASRSSPVQAGTGRYTYISTSENSLTAIDSLGAMYSWGDNTFGQLGNSDIYSWSIISAGQQQVAALRSDNTLWAWGNNSAGQLGDSSTTNKSSPIQIGSSNWLAVSASGSHTVAIQTDYTTWAWGNNINGGLGDGTTISRSSPTQINTGGVSFVSVAASLSNHTLAVTSLGKVYAWGYNISAQLGDGTTINRSQPVQVLTTNSFTTVSAGLTHSLGLSTTNTMFVWGSNAQGQLGIISPTTAIGTSNFTSAPLAYITPDGKLFTWGSNTFGELGQGDTIARYSPVQVGTDTDWSKIFPGNYFGVTAVQKTDGSLWVAGNNATGLFGLNDTVSRSSFTQIPAGPGLSWTTYSTGTSQYNAVAVKSDGTLWTMGNGNSGQIGDGFTLNRSSPVQLAGSWITGAAGYAFAFGIRSDNTLWAWGNNNLGFLGSGNTVYRSSPLQVNSGGSYIQVVAGTSHGAALATNGLLYTWGYNIYGAIGDNTTVSKVNLTNSGGGASYTNVYASSFGTFGLRTDGTLWGWGDASTGLMGNGTAINRSSPAQIGTNSWTQVFVTGNGISAKKVGDNSLWTWGWPTGDGTGSYRSTPVQVITEGAYPNIALSPLQAGTSSWSQISAGYTHSSAIDASGRLFTWGNNSSGQLGYASAIKPIAAMDVTGFLRADGSLFVAGMGAYGAPGQNDTINRSSPVQVGSSKYSSAVFTYNQSYAIRNDGRLFTWGRNLAGQLGLGDTIARSSPVQLGTDSWSMIASSDDYVSNSWGVTIGIKKDYTLWAWGRNDFSQFGTKSYAPSTNVSSPVQVSTSSWTQVALGFDFALGIKPDNTLWAWGNNLYGQLGVPVADASNSWTQISNGLYHTLAIRSDGTTWAWGLNTAGQLGDNTTVTKSAPVQILSGSWTKVSAGTIASLALRNDGTLWTWGDNARGQLGDGTTTARSYPVQVGAVYNSYSTKFNNSFVYSTTNTVFGFGTGDFTVECWFYLTATGTRGDIIAINTGGTPRSELYYDGTNFVYFSNPIGSVIMTGNVAPVANRWYHLAYSRISSVGRMYLDGVQIATNGDTYNLGTTNSVYIGYGNNTGFYFNHYVSNVRIVKGVGVYTGPFTPPTNKLTATQSAGTNIAAITAGQTSLLTLQNPTFIDNSGNNITLFLNSLPVIDYRIVPFTQSVITAKSFIQISAGRSSSVAIQSDNTIWTWGNNTSNELADGTSDSRSSPVQVGATFSTYNYSGSFNGSSTYLSTASSTSLALGLSDFTVDGWFLITASKTHQVLDYVSAGGFGFRIEPTAITMFISQSTSASVTYTVPLNTWTHIAIVRYMGTMSVYVNGIFAGRTNAFTSTNFSSPSDLNIGRNAGGADYFQGNIGGIRITASALYLGEFHPQPALTNSVSTVLLTCQSSTLIDNSRYARTITNNGVTVSTTSATPYSNSWTQIDSFNGSVAALTSDGRLFGWGNNSTGQLNTKPNVVWKTVDQGMAIRADGRLYTWGSNFSGAMGDNTTIDKSSPIQLGTDSDWVMITGGRGQKNNVTSAGYSLGIKADGRLFAWGTNAVGQLGDNSTNPRSSPVQIPGSWSFVDSSSSIWEHVLAIRSDGTLWAWGYNLGGMLGDGTTINRSSPVQIGTSSWLVVSAGYQVAAAIRSDNTLWTWGSNTYGIIGDNTSVSKSSPVQVAGTWRSVSIGNITGYGIKSDYTLWGWGYNNIGNVGDNTITARSSPVQVGIGNSWLMVSGSGESTSGAGGYALAIRLDNTLHGWGANNLGQLGLGDTIARSSPVQIAGSVSDPTGSLTGNLRQTQFSYVKAGGFASFAKDIVGQMWTWGDNGAHVTYGQAGILGNSTIISRSSPVQVGSWDEPTVRSPVQVGIGMSFSSYSLGGDSISAIKTDGTLYSWGANNNYQLGKAYSWTNILGMTSSNFALRNDGVLYIWGNNQYGQSGDNSTVNRSSPTQVSAGANKKWITGAAGLNTMYMIKDDASLWVWGSALDGTLGDNSTINHRSSPVQLAGSWTAVAGVSSAAYGIKTDGTLWSWGLNNAGQLGLGDTISRSSPTQIAGSWSNIWSNDTGANPNVIAKTTSGLIYVWGSNAAGQLGLNDTVSRSSPVQLSGGYPNFARFGTTAGVTMYINTLGQLYAWGTNLVGQLGTGDTIARSSPVQIHTGVSYLAVATAWQTTAAIRSDGTLWTWGNGTGGLLGNNTTVNRSSPVQIATTNKFSDIRAGMSTFYAVSTTDATARLYAWGVNTSGELGDNTTVNRSSPVQVVSNSTAMVYSLSIPALVTSGSWTQIIAARNVGADGSVFAIKSDSTLWGWGNNSTGMLGLNNLTAQASPIQLNVSTNWSTVARGEQTAFALNSAGQLYGTGGSGSGDLGDNTGVSKLTPVSIVPTSQLEPVQIPGSWSTVSVAPYAQFATALTIDGKLFAWGRNDYGQLGQNNSINRSSPVQVLAGSSFVSVSSGLIPQLGTGNAGAVTTDGRLFMWGYNQTGSLGTNDLVNRSSPVQVASTIIWSSISVGGYDSFGTDSTGRIYSWGDGGFGMLGQNDTVARSSPVQVNTVQGLQSVSSPTQVGTNTNWFRVSAGDVNSNALTNAGLLFAWGTGVTGAIGDNTTISRSSPVQLTTLSYSQVATGSSYFVTVVDNDPYFGGNRLLATGNNAQGQLGINSVTASSNLVAVSSMAATNASSPVVTGSSDIDYRSSPVQLGSGNWYGVAAGENHSLGIDSSGSLFGWGYNTNGQVGDSTTINKSSPVQISTTTTWVDVEAGYNYSVVEKSDGSTYTFGNNNDGQLGDGT